MDTSTRVAKLRHAAEEILAVGLDMNTKASPCECCGLTKYENFTEAQMYQVLSPMAEKLRRKADELQRKAEDQPQEVSQS